jgi:hypothetical protein
MHRRELGCMHCSFQPHADSPAKPPSSTLRSATSRSPLARAALAGRNPAQEQSVSVWNGHMDLTLYVQAGRLCQVHGEDGSTCCDLAVGWVRSTVSLCVRVVVSSGSSDVQNAQVHTWLVCLQPSN